MVRELLPQQEGGQSARRGAQRGHGAGAQKRGMPAALEVEGFPLEAAAGGESGISSIKGPLHGCSGSG